MSKAVIFFAPGLEECEGLLCVDLLRRSGVEVTIAAVGGEKIVKSARSISVVADALAEELDYSAFDAAILPGGIPGVDNLKADATVRKVCTVPLIVKLSPQAESIPEMCKAVEAAGADAIRRSNCVILTDGDLFPPGTITLGGLKVFGEESGKVISYAATMAHASESGLSRLFDNLLASDGGFREQVEDVDFYEEGGVGGRIHGETVLFGTAGFMRKRGVNLPRNLGLKTGVFLSVDGTLIAVFAVKYMPAENVDWALHALHHSRITPVLAVRDGNITPALLKRKFGTDARAVYPKLSTRLALSERGGGRPYALLMREGLMPYAEVVLGSKRLCASAKRCTVLAFLAATASTLLAFYLTFVGAYSVLTPFSLLIYVLLWSLSALVDALLSDRY